MQQQRYYDSNTRGFGIRVTSGGVKSYFIEKRIDNKPQFIYNLLQNRYKNIIFKSKFVFPGNSISGYLSDPRKQISKVIKTTNINFTLHDLRRTFITVAESLELSAYALKKLLNHKSGNDVTAGYIILDLERLRQPMQAIIAKLLKLIGLPISNIETPRCINQFSWCIMIFIIKTGVSNEYRYN